MWFLFLLLQCCFTSTATVRTFRDREPRTATSTFTQLMSTGDSQRPMFLYVHRKRKIRDVEPRTTTSTFTQLLSELWNFALRSQRPYGEPRTDTSIFTQLLSSEMCLRNIVILRKCIMLKKKRERKKRVGAILHTALVFSLTRYVTCLWNRTIPTNAAREECYSILEA